MLDAAEHLLAARSYEGVSLRDVATAAGLNLGVLTHHFGSKEELFRQVIARRADDFVNGIRTSLEAALSDDTQALTAERLIRAYTYPAFALAARGGEGWRNYIQLLVRAMNAPQHEAFLAPVLELYDPLIESIINAFRRLKPDGDEEQLQWSFYFLEAALIHIHVEAGIVDRHSRGRCLSSDLDTIFERLVPFFAAGFERTLSLPSREGQAVGG